MAGRIAGITIEIEGNTTKLQSALKDVDGSLKNTQRTLKDVDKLLKLDPTNTDLLKQKQELLKKAIEDTEKKLQMEKDALAQLAAGDQTPEVKAKMEALERQIAEDEAKLKSFKEQMRDFGSVAKQQMQAAGEAVQEVGEKIKGAGEKFMPISMGAAAAGGALLKMGYDAVQSADELNTLSQQTGFGVEELQKLQYASELVDVSVEDITGALRKMKPKMTENNAVFQQLGVSVTNADGSLRSATDVFYDSIAALSQVSNETERDQLAMQLFGKSADELAGIIDDGGAALKQYGEEAAAAGLILSEDTVNSLNETSDTIEKLKGDMSGTMAQIGADVASVLAPALESLGGFISDITAKLRELTPEQTETILKVVAVVAAIGPVLMIIGQIVTGIGGLISAIGMLMSPMGLIVVAIAAVIAIGVLLYKNWDTICEWANNTKEKIVEAWNNVKAKVSEAISNLKQKITEVWNNIKTTVTNVVNGIKTTVSNVWNGIKATVTNVVNGIKATVSNVWNGIKSTVTNVVNGIKSTVTSVWNGIKTAVGSAVDGVKSKVTNVFNSVKSTATSTWNAIKTAISNPIEAAKTAVGNAINAIKAKFNFTWSLPHLKLPHPKISGSFSINPPSVPKFSISWYKKAYGTPYLFTKPTVVGGRGFGDGGGSGELVYGRDALLRDIAAASSGTITVNVYGTSGMNVNQLADAVQDRLVQLQRQKERAYA